MRLCPQGIRPVSSMDHTIVFTWWAGCFISEVIKQWLKVAVSSWLLGHLLSYFYSTSQPFQPQLSVEAAGSRTSSWHRVNSWDSLTNIYFTSQGWSSRHPTTLLWMGVTLRAAAEGSQHREGTSAEIHRELEPAPWCAWAGACLPGDVKCEIINPLGG